MKKIFLFIVIFFILILRNSYCSVNAEERNIYKITKSQSKFGLIQKNENKEILPFKYDKIRKIKYENKLLYIAETPDYITLYSPDGIYRNFLDKYYQANKYNSNIKFENYPKSCIIKYKKNKKYGLIYV